MLLNQRQLEIVLELFENPETYMTSSYFSNKHRCSLRTVQNDIKQIKTEMTSIDCIAFESIARKGCRILIKDSAPFLELRDSYYQQLGSTTINNYPNERITQLLHLLLKEHRAVSLYDLENTMFVSRSTLQNDLKTVNDVIAKYHLELLRGSNKVMIDGSEISKRLCIMEQNLNITGNLGTPVGQNSKAPMERIKNILVETLISFKHPITEASLNNAIVRLYVALQRMGDWFFIAPSDLEITEDLEPERTLATAVYEQIGKEFFIRIPDAEIDYFALYLKGQGNYASTDVISPDIDDLVLNALIEIREQHGIDLTDDLNLRIALTLHTASLIVRLKYDMQLKNHLVDYIRQSFPQGFDLGIYFASYLQRTFHKKMMDDEIAFLAIHLYSALTTQHQAVGSKKIMVISSMRRSENILLRQTLRNWFSDVISGLVFRAPEQVDPDENLDDFILLTTEKNKFYDLGLAFYVDPFPGRQDYLNLKLAIDGFQSIDGITSMFYQDLYCIRDEKDQESILNEMCAEASDYFELEADTFRDAVFQRETMRSTYWGNGIAVPHPLTAVSSDTFISVTVLPQGIPWDKEKHTVNLILMVCIGKNNSKAFQLWNYLAKVLTDKDFTKRLLSDPGYDHFIQLLEETISLNAMN